MSGYIGRPCALKIENILSREQDHEIPRKNVGFPTFFLRIIDIRITIGYHIPMKRDIYQKLLQWKASDRRKPLLLKGARQTGKTYILNEFGNNEYEHTFYFNFEEETRLSEIFALNLEPQRIVRQLSAYRKKKIVPGRDLIIFDEIQASNNALNSLKYFKEQANDYHVVAAGSLLGVIISSPKSFPVGQVNFLDLYPMTFFEFLEAMGEEAYREQLETLDSLEPLPGVLHHRLVDLLRNYYFTGGMPEAVKYFVKNTDFEEVRSIHKEILDSYVLDFGKHAAPVDIPRISQVWDSIPMQLARENKKFVFTALKKSARAREYESALMWLEKSGLILRGFNVTKGLHPLKGFVNRNSFKVFALDVGLLGAMAEIPVDVIARENQLFTQYQGALVENFVAQQLMASVSENLYYWKSEGKMAELDFVLSHAGEVYPLEVKAGINPRSKSLKSYDQQFSPSLLLRTTLLNLKKDGKICNIPLYAISSLPGIVRLAL